MSLRQPAVVLVLAVGTVLAGTGCASEPSSTGSQTTDVATVVAEPTVPTTPSPTTAAETEASEGSYIDYATYAADPGAYADTDVVLFFHAPWCPFCRSADEQISAEAVPAGLTIVKTDFDTETDLRREHGVTVQHTFVHLGPDGESLARWSGSTSAADIVAELA